MKLPLEFHTTNPYQVCHLCKSLYGLQQAPHCWFSILTSSLYQFGFTQSYVDYSLFTYDHKDTFLCILIYVDDFLIYGNHATSILKF